MPGPVGVAVAGVGGFAADHHRAFAALERAGHCRVLATCDPDPERLAFAARDWSFAERGVRTYSDLASMLAHEHPALVSLPTPIPLHAEQHAQVLAAGAGCYLEKPPSLWWPEFEAMRDVERSAPFRTHVGFNFVGDPFRLALKRRIGDGEYGKLLGVSLYGHWPRYGRYYLRNDWAGKIRAQGAWVLDSCIGNAMAHYVQDLLFWAGHGPLNSVAQVEGVRAWLGRAHEIESYDTAVVEGRLSGGEWLRIAATHTGEHPHEEQETLYFPSRAIRLTSWHTAHVCTLDGQVLETLRSSVKDHQDLLKLNLLRYMEYLDGRIDEPTTTLDRSASFVALCDLAIVSAGRIEALASKLATAEGTIEVPGLAARLRSFADEGVWEGGLGEWVSTAELSRLETTARHILDVRPTP